ncbi:MAG: DUF2179 domain-containing protein [Staphylococcus epidermidis]|nr:DUF2179 domain-containing protein [Staphylococcus epidermidis]
MSAIAQNPWLMVLAIFIINVCYVTFLTMRTILTLKGYRYVAAVVSFMEVLVYVVGLGLVMSSLDQIQNIFAYALGFSVGIIVGMKIEEKLALGYTVVNVTSSEYELDLPNELRNLGNLDPKAFIIAYEPRNIHGGFWVKGVRKRKLKAYEPEQLEVVVDHEEIVGGSSNEQKV